MKELKDFLKVEVFNGKITIIKIARVLISKGSRNAILWVRLYLNSHNSFVKVIARNYLIKNYNIYIGKNAEIGEGLELRHPNGIVIGKEVKIGKNAIIYQHVTFGIARKGDMKTNNYPIVGDDCTFFSGAKLLGNIKVGKGTIVGANAVVLTDTEYDSTYVGIPARKL